MGGFSQQRASGVPALKNINPGASSSEAAKNVVVNVQPPGWDPLPTLKSLNHKEDTLRLSKLRRGRGVDDIRHLIGVLLSPLKNPNEQKDVVSWSELEYGHDNVMTVLFTSTQKSTVNHQERP
jgi:hypothetical protein